jgi:hypothetical protein
MPFDPTPIYKALTDAALQIITVVVAVVVLYIQNAKISDIIKFFDPKDNTVLQAPKGLAPVTYVMSAETKAEILKGKTPEAQASLLTQIEANEATGLATYSLVYGNGGAYSIEYGLIKSNVQPKDDFPANMALIAANEYNRTNKMSEAAKLENMRGLTPDEQALFLQQVNFNEDAGNVRYTISIPGKGFLVVENGAAIDDELAEISKLGSG